MSELVKKPEKLASALYLITSFFNDQEPLKWKIRALTTELISLNTLCQSHFFQEREATILKIRHLILEITNLLSVTRSVGLVSDTNSSLLSEELMKYLDLLGLPPGVKTQEGTAVLSLDFFTTTGAERRINISDTDPFHLKDKNPDFNKKSIPVDTLAAKQKVGLRGLGVVSMKKNNRQNIIINLLKTKQEVIIKDISAIIRGCSEKTIQRELLDMVKKGVLKKIGDRRWSRYSLA